MGNLMLIACLMGAAWQTTPRSYWIPVSGAGDRLLRTSWQVVGWNAGSSNVGHDDEHSEDGSSRTRHLWSRTHEPLSR